MSARAFLPALLILVAASWASAQPDPCDPTLKGKFDQQNPNAYRVREDRCEGIFIQEVSTTGGLLVASLTSTMQGFHPAADKQLDLEWKSPGPGTLNLRAYSLRPRLYYRMDTQQNAQAGLYPWPARLVATYALQPSEIGLVAWTSHRLGDQILSPVYVPIAVRDPKNTTWPSNCRLIVVPAADLKELYLTVRPVNAKGDPEKPIRNGALHYGYYPAGAPVRIELADWPRPGFYLVHLAADRKDGVPLAAEFWIYHV
jgi:hypothetical protein